MRGCVSKLLSLTLVLAPSLLFLCASCATLLGYETDENYERKLSDIWRSRLEEKVVIGC